MIAVAVDGSQWDFMYWIYRLQTDEYQKIYDWYQHLNKELDRLANGPSPEL